MEGVVDFDRSVSVGAWALNQCKGNENTAIGHAALFAANGTGDTENTAIGAFAGQSLTSGQRSTFLGMLAGNGSNFNNISCIGYNSGATADNQVQLGDSNTDTYCWNSIQIRSDLRDKSDVRDTVLGLEFIKLLRPVDFRWDYRVDYHEYDSKGIRTTTMEDVESKKDGSKKRNRFHHGVIAQEVKEVIDSTGKDFGGYQDHKINGGEDRLSIGYDEFIGPLIKAVQELSAENEALKARLDAAGL